MRLALAVFLLGAICFAQETATERDAGRVVLKKMDALEKSLDVPGWVARLSASDAARDQVTARAKQLMDSELLAMGDDITRHPEIGFEEKRSVGILVDYLKRHNFDVTMGVAGLPTAFEARRVSGLLLNTTRCAARRGRSTAISTARKGRLAWQRRSRLRSGWSARIRPAAWWCSAVRARR